jgi:hypothetical protein
LKQLEDASNAVAENLGRIELCAETLSNLGWRSPRERRVLEDTVRTLIPGTDARSALDRSGNLLGTAHAELAVAVRELYNAYEGERELARLTEQLATVKAQMAEAYALNLRAFGKKKALLELELAKLEEEYVGLLESITTRFGVVGADT